MALKKNYTVEFCDKKIEFQNCYFKVSKIEGTKEKLIVSVDAMTEQNGKTITRVDYSIVPQMNNDNFIKQAYLYLKTLPEFEDAQDC